MDKLLNTDITQQVARVFTEELQQPVTLLFFGSKDRCEYCEPTLMLLREISPLSSLLTLKEYDLDEAGQVAAEYRVDKTPAIVVAATEKDQIVDYGIRFYGMPSGHEFTSLIHSIILVSKRDAGLNPETMVFIEKISSEVLLQVFVTPT